MLLGCFYFADVAIFELAALGRVEERVLPENVPKKKAHCAECTCSTNGYGRGIGVLRSMD